MLNTEQAARLRALIDRHAYCQFQVGKLSSYPDQAGRDKAIAAADVATRALCAALVAVTKEDKKP